MIQDAADKVSVGQYRAYEVNLENMGLGLYGGPAYNQGYRNRDGWANGGTLGNGEARLYLTDQLTTMGLIVSVPGVYKNVVAEWPGRETPQEIYIVCAHYDTTSIGERPGGDDNASGTAGMLEAARVLTQYQFKSTLRFVAFNAEEDWMKGSQEYVNALPKDANIAGVINLDMILRPAWDSNAREPADLDVETLDVPHCITWVETFIAAAAVYVPSLVIDPNSHYPDYWGAGDHGPFITAGYAALLAIENTVEEVWYGGSNVYYHSSQDASEALANDANSPSGVTYDYDFAANVVKATVATLAVQAAIIPPADPNAGPPPIPPVEGLEQGRLPLVLPALLPPCGDQAGRYVLPARR
jgi:Zn-dependent M28 family amino/carboxypeptidase